MKLIANMVGFNEANRYLEEVLRHLKTVSDEIVFTDDCSTDNTMQIASRYAHTYQTPDQLFTKDEGKLRTIAWSNLEKHAEVGDWVLAIDCDEKLWSSKPNMSLSKLMNQDSFDVLNVMFFHMWNYKQFRVDKAWAPNNSSRLFRYQEGGVFRDRKLACGSEPTYVQDMIGAGKYLVDSGLIMQHLGYVRDEDKKAKYERYMSLDGGDFHARAHIESIIDPNPTLVDWSI